VQVGVVPETVQLGVGIEANVRLPGSVKVTFDVWLAMLEARTPDKNTVENGAVTIVLPELTACVAYWTLKPVAAPL
jgi:hypothetical protein